VTKTLKVGDLVFYLKRPCPDQLCLPDDKGEWLAGAARVLSIIDSDGDRINKKDDEIPIGAVSSIRALTMPSDDDPADIITLMEGEFTTSIENYIANLLA